MDGSPSLAPGGLPPLAGAPQPGYPGMARLAPAPTANPVGRPSADPEQQEVRQERHAERKRIQSVLPKQATDSKIQIFKLKGGRPIPNARPVMTILMSDLEKARDEGLPPEEFIASKLAERFERGRFQCVVHDRLGKRVPEVSPWDVSLDDEGDENDDEGDDDDEIEEIPPYGAPGFPGVPFAQMPQMQMPVQPPAPPQVDVATLAQSFRAERNDEAKRSGEMMTIVTTMMQQSSQQAMIMQQQQQARDEQYRREQADREDRARKEAADREERAEKRRAERTQMLLAALPLALPMVTKMLGLDKDKAADPMTLLLIEMVKQKSPDSDILKQTGSIMAEMTKTQMQLQGAGATAAVEMQAKASGVVFDNMLKTMKELMANQAAPSEKEDSTLEQIAKIAGPLMQALQQNQPAQPMPQPGQPQQAAQPVAEQPVQAQVIEAPRKRPAPRPRAPLPPQQPPAAAADEYTPEQRIRGSLTVVKNMTMTGDGSIPPEERWNALQWIGNTLPENVRNAVANGSKDDVVALCASAAITDPKLINWLKDTDHVQFLEDAIVDLQALLAGKVTKEHAQKAINAQVSFIARRVNTAQASIGKTAAATTESVVNAAPPAAAEPIAGPGSQPPAAAAEEAPKPRARARRAPATPPPSDDTPPATGD